MLITVHKPFHVPYVSLITTSGTIFTKIFLIAKVKTLAKKLFVSPSRKRDEKEKKKKN